ncbi:MAG: rod shape-determining protein MreD [Clostridia bacterium]|nr:rod shape-determining protein MreD [Clostridia bacterium]
MKKFIINIIIIITFVIIYILHSNLFTWFKIAGVMPNLFVIFVLFIGLYANKYMGVTYGIIFGLLLDLFLSRNIGISAIMLGIVGIIGVVFDKNFSKENRITLIVMVILSTIVFETGEYLVSFFINKFDLEIITFIQILLIECLYNSILTIILYPLIQNLGNRVETEYKGNKILTRYF